MRSRPVLAPRLVVLARDCAFCIVAGRNRGEMRKFCGNMWRNGAISQLLCGDLERDAARDPESRSLQGNLAPFFSRNDIGCRNMLQDSPVLRQQEGELAPLSGCFPWTISGLTHCGLLW